jgi:hypothetical protein
MTRFGQFRGVGRLSRAMLGLSLLDLLGCAHKAIHVDAALSLEKTSGYPILVPSVSPITLTKDFQTSLVSLRSSNLNTSPAPMQQCSIVGSVFSLSPAVSSRVDQWLIKSPSDQGWETHGEIDVREEWDRFTAEISSRVSRGCFPAGESVSSVIRAIAERMPLPASESLLFFYSLGNAGYVDLSPGMQIRIESTVHEKSESKQNSATKPESFFAQYEIVPLSETGVALELSKADGRQIRKSSNVNVNLILHLPVRFAKKPILRLFLASLGNDRALRSPILIGSSDLLALEVATSQIEKMGDGACPSNVPTSVDCIAFGRDTAISLLSSIWINGRLLYYPIGTTVGYIIEIYSKSEIEQSRIIETLSLRRPLEIGGYAKVSIPKTLTSAQQVILLNGDRLTWKH